MIYITKEGNTIHVDICMSDSKCNYNSYIHYYIEEEMADININVVNDTQYNGSCKLNTRIVLGDFNIFTALKNIDNRLIELYEFTLSILIFVYSLIKMNYDMDIIRKAIGKIRFERDSDFKLFTYFIINPLYEIKVKIGSKEYIKIMREYFKKFITDVEEDIVKEKSQKRVIINNLSDLIGLVDSLKMKSTIDNIDPKEISVEGDLLLDIQYYNTKLVFSQYFSEPKKIYFGTIYKTNANNSKA